MPWCNCAVVAKINEGNKDRGNFIMLFDKIITHQLDMPYVSKYPACSAFVEWSTNFLVPQN